MTSHSPYHTHRQLEGIEIRSRLPKFTFSQQFLPNSVGSYWRFNCDQYWPFTRLSLYSQYVNNVPRPPILWNLTGGAWSDCGVRLSEVTSPYKVKALRRPIPRLHSTPRTTNPTTSKYILRIQSISAIKDVIALVAYANPHIRNSRYHKSEH